MEEPAIHSLWGSVGMIQTDGVFLSLKPPCCCHNTSTTHQNTVLFLDVQGHVPFNKLPLVCIKESQLTSVSMTSFVHRCTGVMTLWPSSIQSSHSCTLILNPLLGQHERTLSTSSLTSTDAPGHSHIVAIITLQPFVMVARLHGAAVLVKLCSAHLAAPTSIWNCANPWRASQRLLGAVTHWWAASSHLKGGERQMSHATFSTVKINSPASPKQSQLQKREPHCYTWST